MEYVPSLSWVGIAVLCATTVVVSAIVYVVLIKCGKKPLWYRLLSQFALLAWAFVFALILQSVRYYPTDVRTTPFNLMPFQFLAGGGFSMTFLAKQFLYNALLFVPFGVLFPAAFPKFRVWAVVVVAFLLSLVVELAQFVRFVVGGSGDIDDIIARVMGAAMGMMLFVVIGRRAAQVVKWLITPPRTPVRDVIECTIPAHNEQNDT
jgi:glycopeptide antibiotics resistance protein